ncbi:hypothetical protein HPB50_001503 [Hyalomma asiaticum]|uniref:Uncharacterized protein n=1 Tax=Hyalomma asiaticum TaxID=266040 RepID=A0ACB7T7R1_HYAAI|nr:hypothetical protein HPB50_001503 [Hyalomma asiaticum]
MTDQEQTMGEDAPSECATDDSDWKIDRCRQQRRIQDQFLLNDNAANLTSQHNQQGMKPQRIKGSVIKAGRMPRLPKEHEKVIIRPQGGLNIAQTPTLLLASAILATSGIEREDTKEDILSPNAQQNIVVASSPSTEHTERYKQTKHLVINNKRYEVNTYASALDQTPKVVIRGIHLEHDNKTV